MLSDEERQILIYELKKMKRELNNSDDFTLKGLIDDDIQVLTAVLLDRKNNGSPF
ncbi:hypothetical protein [Alteribacter aurantiacus]|uniref:hypothetical protein n=1 Tax=Alteribacter aurantiacus TaxID=254410 RepID=UPI0012EC1580|nr:hypothetical protein [Alteribacter aurantiacus]